MTLRSELSLLFLTQFYSVNLPTAFKGKSNTSNLPCAVTAFPRPLHYLGPCPQQLHELAPSLLLQVREGVAVEK